MGFFQVMLAFRHALGLHSSLQDQLAVTFAAAADTSASAFCMYRAVPFRIQRLSMHSPEQWQVGGGSRSDAKQLLHHTGMLLGSCLFTCGSCPTAHSWYTSRQASSVLGGQTTKDMFNSNAALCQHTDSIKLQHS
jgi:hypothetical protein